MENKYITEFSFTQDDVIRFAEVTGDKNPVHLDPEYAKITMFKQPIMHGFLSASVFSRILGTEFPGEGTIYLSQNMKFRQPMFVNRSYQARVEVLEVMEKGRARLKTDIIDDKGDLTITGEAVVMHKMFNDAQ